MVRRRASRGRQRRRVTKLFGCFATAAAAHVLFAGASVSDGHRVRGFAPAFAATDRQVAGGEKVDAQTGRAGKSRRAASRWSRDRIGPGGFGSSGCVGGVAEKGIHAGDGQGAIRNSRWTARSGGASEFRRRSGSFLQSLARAAAESESRRFVCRPARQRFLHTRSI